MTLVSKGSTLALLILAVVGDPDECVANIQRYFDAGADGVGLFAMPNDQLTRIATDAAKGVLPKLR